MIYRAHGDHQLQWHDNIVVARLHGTWNEEAADEYRRTLKKQVKSLQGHAWCRVVDLSDYELHTPEVVGPIQDFADWAEQNGCIFHCYVFANLLQREAVKQMFNPGSQEIAVINEAPTVEDGIAACRQALERYSPDSGELQRR